MTRASATADRLELERLRVLVEASKLINSSIEPTVLFSTIVTLARERLGVERGTLFFVDEARQEIWARIPMEGDVSEIRLPMGKGIAGTVAATGETVVVPDAWADPRFDASVDRRSGFRTRSILCVPIRNRGGRIVGVLQLLNKREGGFGASDLEFLELVSGHVAIGMENATLHLSLLEKDRMQRELALGKEIQKRLLPEPPRGIPGTEIAATSVACFEVSGDAYDFLELPSGDLGLSIADVSGKGVAAALVMSSLQAALRVAAPLDESPVRLTARLDKLIHELAGGRKYVTFFFGCYSPATGRLRYVNAGHNPPLMVSGGQVTPLGSTGCRWAFSRIRRGRRPRWSCRPEPRSSSTRTASPRPPRRTTRSSGWTASRRSRRRWRGGRPPR
ncbi:MAG: SpoIIE family protein phosphatase [Holophagales bacterium]|nr:SpoIIE family protein phosphatase [Holophagales bacterium]